MTARSRKNLVKTGGFGSLLVEVFDRVVLFFRDRISTCFPTKSKCITCSNSIEIEENPVYGFSVSTYSEYQCRDCGGVSS